MTRGFYDNPRNASAYDREHDGHEITIEDIPFYVELARESRRRGLPVLELGAGTGRVTLPIAREGMEVVGLDNAEAMLEIARTKSERDGLGTVSWRVGEMTDFELGRRFGLVIIPFRSFQLLTTVAEQISCLRCIHRHLADGGRLALNLFNPELLVRASKLGRRTSKRESGQEGRVAGESHALVSRGLTDEGAVIVRERGLRQRYVSRGEMQQLLAATGFRVGALYGWFDRRDFTEASSEMVWLVSKTTLVPAQDRSSLLQNRNK